MICQRGESTSAIKTRSDMPDHTSPRWLTRSGVLLVWPLLNYRYGLRVMSAGGLSEQIINLICLGIIGWMVVSML
jgi:hypothetical protein